eukprot:gb/GECH01013671.1/.p1 GENE.gb/GECH01013671.1/~~gb/GECH01013671.1/.p1  ORF type:complete len:227 (+),score=60.71 gb/GECH01013671.1/:1-681(+)
MTDPISSKLQDDTDAPTVIVELCKAFYQQGWVSGTGGGISIRRDGKVWIAPSGVQKERIRKEDIFVMDNERNTITKPENESLKVSACTPLFYAAYDIRDAGAVIHSHSLNAMLATLICEHEFSITQVEMIKGIQGHGYFDTLTVPVIENTAHESELAEAMKEAIEKYPHTYAVLVRRHGVYVWGKDWIQAKTHAECYDYLFSAALNMHRMGFDPSPSNKSISAASE